MDLKFKDFLDIPCGIRFVFNNLKVSSTYSRSILLEEKFIKSKEEIEQSYLELSQSRSLFGSGAPLEKLSHRLRRELSSLKGIAPSLHFISKGGVADDIILFEIKELSLLNQKISKLLEETNSIGITLPNLDTPLSLLDPEGAAINSFYIYDSYSPQLKGIREKIRECESFDPELFRVQQRIEEEVRKELSEKLKESLPLLFEAIESLAKLDIILAKTVQIDELGLTIPQIGDGKISYKGLFNPEVEEILKRGGNNYQKVDIELYTDRPTLIVGSNMGGKSVTIKSLALSQILFQFTFGIAALQSKITPLNGVLHSMGVAEDWERGLSSFGAEMERINNILVKSKSSGRVLILLDEPASATNPIEGSALVSSLLTQLSNRELFCVVTTHYKIEGRGCNLLRVKGLDNGKMDYSLLKFERGEFPYEALKVAEMLGVDREWLEGAKKELRK
ncbi:MAG: hypothetical protein WC960_03545 [Bacteroidales bacterium]